MREIDPGDQAEFPPFLANQLAQSIQKLSHHRGFLRQRLFEHCGMK
jgi:hypothetical protein